MAAKTRAAIMLNRGRRYRHDSVTYFRNVPKVVDEEVAQYLVDETGFFRNVRIDAQGRPITPKVVGRRGRQRGRRSRIHSGDRGEPDLADTGDAPNTAGAAEV